MIGMLGSRLNIGFKAVDAQGSHQMVAAGNDAKDDIGRLRVQKHGPHWHTCMCRRWLVAWAGVKG